MRRAHNGSGHILGHVQVRPASVEPNVLGLHPGQAASQPGRVYDISTWLAQREKEFT